MSTLTMTEEDRRAHAKRALEEFQRLIGVVYRPLLRAITRNPKLNVVPDAKVSATDGKTVFLMVPWVLGETREHDRSLCSKRDPASFAMLCPACAARDEIDSTVFHESAHITSESFEEVDPNKYTDLVRQYAPFIDADALKLPFWYQGRRVYVQVLAGLTEGVFLPIIQNVVEDIYVNRRLFLARPGVEASLQAHMVKIFSKGFNSADGTHQDWAERPVDMQAIISTYNLGMRLPHLNARLTSDVDAVKNDQVIIDLMEEIPGEGSAYIRAEIGLRLLARLRELGFCIPPSQKPEPDPEEDEGEGDDAEEPDDPDEESEDGGQGEPCEDGEESDGESEDEGSKGNGGSGSTKGAEASDDDEDAEAQGHGGTEKSDEESDEVGDPTAAGDDEEGEGGEPSDEESDDDESKAGQGVTENDEDDDATEGDFEGEDDAGDDDGDKESASGSGENEDDDESYEEGDDEAGSDSGKSPEEQDAELAEELAKMAKQMMGHEDEEQESGDYTKPEDGLKPSPSLNSEDGSNDIDQAIRWQKFDAPPTGVHDFLEQDASNVPNLHGNWDFATANPIDFDPGLVSGETAHLRATLAVNRKTRMTGSLKSGPKLDVPNLHRIGQDDFRIFGRKDRPARRDWFVLVGLDDSGSTLTNGAAKVMRELGLGLGEMLNGVGIKFAMYAHSGRNLGAQTGNYGQIGVTHKVIKTPDEPWTSETKDRLQYVCREDSANMDGHTLEQYRKIVQARRETDKMILYVTDGAMPMFNYDEELEVLQRELETLKRLRVNMFGVGYRTDSPKEHGMDTIVIKGGQDLPSLVAGLRTRLEV